MDPYLSSLLLGAVGLGTMAVGGLGHQSHAGQAGHGAHAGHGGHASTGAHAAHSVHQLRGHGQSIIWAIMSPRFLFSLAIGFGAAGELVHPFLGGVFQLAAALAGGIAFERFIVSPLWNFTMRFASTPAVTLESAITDEATAVTSFDANGNGIVSLEVDGQMVQVLATLQRDDRSLGVRVRAGQRVRIEEVDPASNQCTVSLL